MSPFLVFPCYWWLDLDLAAFKVFLFVVKYFGFTKMYLCIDFTVFFLLAICWYIESVDCLSSILEKIQPFSLHILPLILSLFLEGGGQASLQEDLSAPLPSLSHAPCSPFQLAAISFVSFVLHGNFHVFVFPCYILDSFFSSVLQFTNF